MKGVCDLRWRLIEEKIQEKAQFTHEDKITVMLEIKNEQSIIAIRY